jgi:hypothetical protein
VRNAALSPWRIAPMTPLAANSSVTIPIRPKPWTSRVTWNSSRSRSARPCVGVSGRLLSKKKTTLARTSLSLATNPSTATHRIAIGNSPNRA